MLILTATCPDTAGIVAAVAGLLSGRGAFITESAHFGDSATGKFFMRTVFRLSEGDSAGAIAEAFGPVAARFGMTWRIDEAARRARVMILVSKFDHCLNDLLYRWRTGALPIDIPAIVSNHPDLAPLAAWHGIPFHHLPVTAATKPQQEAELLKLAESHAVDLVVLARYMQVLSADLSAKLAGRCINIHHSFLPSFKGARPYHQAWERGVKLIGATAHYVTSDLDEGPIIEQEVERVNHANSAEEFVALGRDIESVVLARAVLWHVQHRVLPNGRKTVVFR